jgi:hypothetical protein
MSEIPNKTWGEELRAISQAEDDGIVELGEAHVYAVPSSDQARPLYYVLVFPQARRVVCDPHCKGFNFRGKCRHIAKLRLTRDLGV